MKEIPNPNVDPATKTSQNPPSSKPRPDGEQTPNAPTSVTENSSESAENFPIVGIGASAGGLIAYEIFFSSMPEDRTPDMAFVLVQHLAPNHKSVLCELIQRRTKLKVYEAENGMPVQINCIYVTPPNCDLAILNGCLQLLTPNSAHGQHKSIDFFFKSLAQDQKERAVGIILSGSGNDGVNGIKAIKDEGGIVIAQTVDSAEFSAMPQNAINTGLTDFQLASSEMSSHLIDFARHAMSIIRDEFNETTPSDEHVMKAIFVLLRAQTTHDFSNYKSTTTHRRIKRRMGLHLIDHLPSYFKLLQHSPTELEALFRDLLIGVTNFFRDKEAFEALEQEIIPKLFENQPLGSTIRTWSIGCSTGEEAYSLAMLMQERRELIKQNYKIQIFATDMDTRAIAIARAGIYPNEIVADVSEDRLKRFFTADIDGSSYRINKNIRDMLIFSEHDIIKDMPFSKMDLISCRNLLIYLNRNLQKKLIPLFHYSLMPDGILFLGSSESVDEFDDLFVALDRRAKIYQHKINSQNKHRSVASNFIKSMSLITPTSYQQLAAVSYAGKQSLRELTEQTLLQQLAPASVLVNAQGNILYLHGRTGMYLEPSPGESGVNNVLKMARDGLRPWLSMLLHKVVTSNQTERALNISVKTNGHFTLVDLTICPTTLNKQDTVEVPLYLIAFENTPEASPKIVIPLDPSDHEFTTSMSDAAAHITMLQQQLTAKDHYIVLTQEKLESSNEELRCTNEEMQSINEELQSTNEEMETSKEELQSVNEELATVNTELQSKVSDLTHANNHMHNMLAGTGIGTLFVDHQLRILSFTPVASKIINLINSDIGRSIAHIVNNLVNYNTLVDDIKSVLDTLVSKEIDVLSKEGSWYKLRIQPYRTLTNMIEGAVVTFVDVTALKISESNLRQLTKQLTRMSVVLRDSYDAITVCDLTGQILAWNPSAERMYGWTEAQALQMNVSELIPPELLPQAKESLIKLYAQEILQPLQTQRINKNGEKFDVMILKSALLNESGEMYAVSTIERLLK